MDTHQIFPFDMLQNDLIKFCYQERKKDPKGVVKSNSGGWQSHDNYKEDGCPLVDPIVNGIKENFYLFH